MKKSLISATVIALALSAGAALAADLPSRKEAPVYVPPPPPPLWTGFYAGLNAGGTWGNSNSVTVNAGPAMGNPLATQVYTVNGFTAPLGANLLTSSTAAASAAGVLPGGSNGGFLGGGQVGYNYQFYNSFVVGIEADIQGIASSNSTVRGLGAAVDPTPVFGPLISPFATISQVQTSLDYLGTVRGRIGYLVTPTLLAYATGGLAYGGVNMSASYASFNTGVGSGVAVPASTFAGPGFGAASFSDTLVGWTVGGGVEWMFLPNWSAKLEYLYYDLGSVTTPTAFVGGFTNGGNPSWAYAANATARFNGNIVRAGVNYHFNWGAPAPVVAKY
jgi:outer membrane immunogenic protein